MYSIPSVRLRGRPRRALLAGALSAAAAACALPAAADAAVVSQPAGGLNQLNVTAARVRPTSCGYPTRARPLYGSATRCR